MGTKPKSAARVWGPGKSHRWTGIRTTSRETNTASVPRHSGMDGRGKESYLLGNDSATPILKHVTQKGTWR